MRARCPRSTARSSRRIKRVKACRFLIVLEDGADEGGRRGGKEKSGQDARVQRRVPRAGGVAARSSRRIKRAKACRFLIELEDDAGDVGAARGRKMRARCPRSTARSSRRIKRTKTCGCLTEVEKGGVNSAISSNPVR